MLEAIPPIVLAALAILFGFVALIWSADRFVAGAAAIASSFGVAPLVIGLTIVSFGTSAPEVMVSINASLKNAGDLAIGNALGSNIANIGLVLAVTCLIVPIPVQKHVLLHEAPVLLIVTLIAGLILYDGTISLVDGCILLGLLIPSIFYIVKCKQKDLSEEEIAEEEAQVQKTSTPKAIFWFLLGLVALMYSSDMLVWGARNVAEHYSVSPLIIGLTVIAIGTSLPELAASVVSAIKGHHDIALGNIVGSNIFNLLAVMGIPGLISPPSIGEEVFYRDYLIMLAITVALIALIIFSLRNSFGSNTIDSKARIGRFAGAFMLLSYLGYYFYLFSFSV
ncbi:calcium/sodium antiporter [Teredinibacter sp. KSP-S5-2]|uniref:calcium/sodium antiporter n=1 Tax=Teredinibacter sp. KSP-S5-2 TaxID=3034506 RepID=UPI002934B0EA|nr:calcium/sodium antiporter [Teredinibacter sp. KSP-S5-2]WNO09592.1 calcium/sodium antiporter [Teredinibacter sp. KSP-S5-2]